MSFKIGDRIRYVGNEVWGHEWQNSTVVKVDGRHFWFVDDTNLTRDGCQPHSAARDWQLITPKIPTTNPFLKTVTKIVGGTHIFEDSSAVVDIIADESGVRVTTDHYYTSADLAVLGRMLIAISEVAV